MTESYDFRRFIKALSRLGPLNFEAFSSTLAPDTVLSSPI